jgi:uncharacterized protein YegL
MKTMICLILDRSGSMAGRENDVIGGVNTFLDEQKKLPDPASIAFVRFDTEGTERFRAMGPLSETQPLTAADYQPRGGTPLLDAVGTTIVKLDDDWKAEQPERCILVIITDGEENSSREYTKAKIKEMIESRQTSGKWAFIYLGANVDAFHEAGQMGIMAANTAGYVSSAKGTRSTFSAASASVGNMRTTGATLADNLGGNLDEETGKVDKTVAAPKSKSSPAKPWTAPQPAGPWTPPK